MGSNIAPGMEICSFLFCAWVVACRQRSHGWLIPHPRYPAIHLKDPYSEKLILKRKRRENLIHNAEEEEI
jgi:hypothetical protein